MLAVPRAEKPYSVTGLKRRFGTARDAVRVAATRARKGIESVVAVHDARYPGTTVAICEYWSNQYRVRGSAQRDWKAPKGHGSAHARCFVPGGRAALYTSPRVTGGKLDARAKRTYDRAYARGAAASGTSAYTRAADAWAYRERHAKARR